MTYTKIVKQNSKLDARIFVKNGLFYAICRDVKTLPIVLMFNWVFKLFSFYQKASMKKNVFLFKTLNGCQGLSTEWS